MIPQIKKLNSCRILFFKFMYLMYNRYLKFATQQYELKKAIKETNSFFQIHVFNILIEYAKMLGYM